MYTKISHDLNTTTHKEHYETTVLYLGTPHGNNEPSWFIREEGDHLEVVATTGSLFDWSQQQELMGGNDCWGRRSISNEGCGRQQAMWIRSLQVVSQNLEK